MSDPLTISIVGWIITGIITISSFIYTYYSSKRLSKQQYKREMEKFKLENQYNRVWSFEKEYFRPLLKNLNDFKFTIHLYLENKDEGKELFDTLVKIIEEYNRVIDKNLGLTNLLFKLDFAILINKFPILFLELSEELLEYEKLIRSHMYKPDGHDTIIYEFGTYCNTLSTYIQKKLGMEIYVTLDDLETMVKSSEKFLYRTLRKNGYSLVI